MTRFIRVLLQSLVRRRRGSLMNNSESSSKAGFSIVELLIVITIAVILTTFAVIRFTGARENFQRQNVAREFKNSLERARFDAVKRRPTSTSDMSVVRVLSATSFSYTTDRNQNGVIDGTAETLTIDFSQRAKGVRIVGDGFVYPITIAFDRRGQIRVRNGADQPMTPIFYFCDRGCTPSTANSANSNIVYVSPTGTVAMMQGGDTIPTFTNPSVTAVASDFSVNPMLSVWDADTSATPNPSPTPTPITLPTPSPIPSPSISPTPSPTPPACTVGQKESVNNCKCVSPMWVRKNGKCM